MCLVSDQSCFHSFFDSTNKFWCFVPFGNQLNPDCFKTVSVTSCSCFFAILSPSEPSEVLGMYAVVYVIILCNFTSQSDLDCFQTFTLSFCTGFFSVFTPVLFPTDVLNMCTIFDRSRNTTW